MKKIENHDFAAKVLADGAYFCKLMINLKIRNSVRIKKKKY